MPNNSVNGTAFSDIWVNFSSRILELPSALPLMHGFIPIFYKLYVIINVRNMVISSRKCMIKNNAINHDIVGYKTVPDN